MMTGASLCAKKSAGVRNGGFFTLRSARSIFGGVHAAAENKFANIQYKCNRGRKKWTHRG